MSHEPYQPLANAQRSDYTHPGFADHYAAYRPAPPRAIVDLLLQVAGIGQPELVVDLGCGTGLSTFIWAQHARQVLGIEPLDTMLNTAQASNTAPNVRFQGGVAQETGLPDGVADIVTCAQALHWMEPESTFAEVARILRVGGVFAAYDYDRTPTVQWEAERAFDECMARREQVWQKGALTHSQQWPKSEHLARMQECGHFRYVKEVVLHNTEKWTAERWVGYALSTMPGMLERGLSSADLGLDQLREVAERTMGDRELPAYFSYRVRLGIK